MIILSFDQNFAHCNGNVLWKRSKNDDSLKWEKSAFESKYPQDSRASSHINNGSKIMFLSYCQQNDLQTTLSTYVRYCARDHPNVLPNNFLERDICYSCWHYQLLILKRQFKIRFLEKSTFILCTVGICYQDFQVHRAWRFYGITKIIAKGIKIQLKRCCRLTSFHSL